MPRKQAHLDAATIPGLLAGLYWGRELVGGPFVAHLLGSVTAACYGGILPDLIEPSLNNPRHRAFWHSQLLLGAASRLSLKPPARVLEWRGDLLAEAARLRTERETLAQDHPDRWALWLAEMFGCFVAGCLVGLSVGYAVHLFQDAGTPSGLPLLRADRS